MMTPNAGRARRIDSGAPLVFELGGSGSPATMLGVWTSSCSNPDCTCTEMELAVAEMKRVQGGKLERGGRAFEIIYDVGPKTFMPPRVFETFSPEASERALRILSEEHRDWLHERWERSRGVDDDGVIPSDWKPGELAVYNDVFPRGWDLVVAHEGRHYLAEDMYCLKNGCTCKTLAVGFYEIPSGSCAGDVQTSFPGLKPRESKRGDKTLASPERLLAKLDPQKLTQRHERIRAFVKRDAARKAAPMPERPISLEGATTWVVRAHLLDTDPPVWRRLEVRKDQTIAQLGRGLSSAMGWSVGKVGTFKLISGELGPYLFTLGLELDPFTTLEAAKLVPGARARYQLPEFTFEVMVEWVRPFDPAAKYPRLIDGEGAAPDELSGIVDAENAELMEKDLPLPAEAARDVPRDADDIERVLETTHSLLMLRTRDRILAIEGAGPKLLELFTRRGGGREEPSWTEVHAARLLGDLEYEPAIGSLIAAFARFPPDSPLMIDLAFALAGMGHRAIGPVLEAYARATGVLDRGMFRMALANTGYHDARIYEVLVDALRTQQPSAADDLRSYEDRRALGPLREEMKRLLPIASTEDDLIRLSAIADAIEGLGSALTARELDRLIEIEDRIGARLEPAEPPPPSLPSATAAPFATKRGRNDPCWCGSGKKYKKCHLASD